MTIKALWDLSFKLANNGVHPTNRISYSLTSSLNKGGRATLLYNICNMLDDVISGEISADKTKDGILVKRKDGAWLHWVNKKKNLQECCLQTDISLKGNDLHFKSNGFFFAPFLADLKDSLKEVSDYLDLAGLNKGIGHIDRNAYYQICDYMYYARDLYLAPNYDLDNIEYKKEPVVLKHIFGPPITKGKTGTSGSDSVKMHTAAELVPFKLKFNPEPWQQLLIPDYDLSTMVIPQSLVRLARTIHGEIESRKPVNNILLYGESGSGKTTQAKMLAQLLGLPYKNHNFSYGFEESDFLGKYLPQPDGRFLFQVPMFARFFKDGGVFEFTEMDYARAEVLGFLNTPLDPELNLLKLADYDGTEIKRHPMCIIVATMNVDDVACQKMANALKKRFPRKIHVRKAERDLLIRIIKLNSGYDNEKVIDKMIDVCEELCEKIKNDGWEGCECTTRELIAWANEMKYTSDPNEAAEDTIVSGVTFDETLQEEIRDVIRMHF